MHKKIGVLGVGNTLLQDEGFGVFCVEALEDRYELPDNLAVMDGGTAGIMLASFMEENDIVFVMDAVAIEGKPGSIHLFTDEDVKAGNIQSRMSPHQVGLLEVLELCKLREQAPEKIEMITAVPASLEAGIGLTPALEDALDEALFILKEKLESVGVTLTEKSR